MESLEEKDRKLMNIIETIKKKENDIITHSKMLKITKQTNNMFNDIYNDYVEYNKQIVFEKLKEINAMLVLYEYLDTLKDKEEEKNKIIDEIKKIESEIINYKI